jgi:hypothetical protein
MSKKIVIEKYNVCYRGLSGVKIIYYGLKSSIFIKVDDLLLSRKTSQVSLNIIIYY